MALKMNDKSIGITIPNAYIRIDYLVINPGLPIEEKDEEGNIISSKKTYNVLLFVHYSSVPGGEIYARDVVSIDGLLENELTFEEYYTRLKAKEKFAGAKDV